MRAFLLSAASLCVLASAAQAETYSASGVDLKHVAATLRVIPEDRANIDIQIAPGGRLAAPSVRVEDGRLVVDGGLENRFRGCRDWNGSRTIEIEDVGSVPVSELAVITIRTPRTLDLKVGGAVFTDIGASQGGRVTLNGCGDTTMGSAGGALELTLNGSGDVEAGAVSGALDAVLNGSGDVRFVRAGDRANLRLNGSGDLTVGDIAGALDGRLNGSGNLTAGSSAGARLSLNGSGDVEGGAVRGSLDARLQGSGNIVVASVEGPETVLRLGASGDVEVRGGRTGRLSADNHGSGNLRFAGRADVVSLAVHSSGDVSVSSAERIESMQDRGSGEIHIGR